MLSGKGQLTPDARFAVFEASHDGLGLADRGSHVFLRDVRTGTTIVADRADGPSGSPAHDAWAPSASADGRLVAFTTGSRLVPADTNTYDDIYVRDVVANTTRLVSRTPAGAAANGDSDDAMISADGRRVAFDSDASDLGDGDGDADTDVHVLDLGTDAMTYVSRAAAPGDGASSDPVIDADGSTVAFTSNAANLDPADTDTMADVYVRDLAAGRRAW